MKNTPQLTIIVSAKAPRSAEEIAHMKQVNALCEWMTAATNELEMLLSTAQATEVSAAEMNQREIEVPIRKQPRPVTTDFDPDKKTESIPVVDKPSWANKAALSTALHHTRAAMQFINQMRAVALKTVDKPEGKARVMHELFQASDKLCSTLGAADLWFTTTRIVESPTPKPKLKIVDHRFDTEASQPTKPHESTTEKINTLFKQLEKHRRELADLILTNAGINYSEWMRFIDSLSDKSDSVWDNNQPEE